MSRTGPLQFFGEPGESIEGANLLHSHARCISAGRGAATHLVSPGADHDERTSALISDRSASSESIRS